MVSPGRGTPGICLIGMCRPKRYGFCSVLVRFGSENEYRLCLFWSEFGYGFEGNTGVHERICRFNSK